MSFPREITYLAAIVAVVVCAETVSAQKLREMAREQSIRNPGVPLLIPQAPSDYLPKTIEELAMESEVVLQARMSKVESYLGASGNQVLTDFSILAPQVIAGRINPVSVRRPGAGVPLILTVWGGEVVVDGVPIRGVKTDSEPIKDGAQYLLFLRQARQSGPGRYEIYYGGAFEIVHGEAKPLLRNADTVFKGTNDTHLTEMTSRIQKATRGR
jgi:hypothetical protein